MTAPRAVGEQLWLFELGCFHGGASAAGLDSAGGSSCLCPGPSDPGLAFVPGRLHAGAAHHTGSQASLPSFVLVFPPRILRSRSRPSPSLSIGFFSCSLEAISEHKTSRHAQSCPSCSLVTPSLMSPLPASLCPRQPVGDPGQSPWGLGLQALPFTKAPGHFQDSGESSLVPVHPQVVSKRSLLTRAVNDPGLSPQGLPCTAPTRSSLLYSLSGHPTVLGLHTCLFMSQPARVQQNHSHHCMTEQLCGLQGTWLSSPGPPGRAPGYRISAPAACASSSQRILCKHGWESQLP